MVTVAMVRAWGVLRCSVLFLICTPCTTNYSVVLAVDKSRYRTADTLEARSPRVWCRTLTFLGELLLSIVLTPVQKTFVACKVEGRARGTLGLWYYCVRTCEGIM